jgi:hypothetical protein
MRGIRNVRLWLAFSAALLIIALNVQGAGKPSAEPPAQREAPQHLPTLSHVLLISIDGMHALDFINCANGIAGANGGNPYCPNLAGLKSTGVSYLYAATSRPSDSFPGLMALVSGGSPRSVGAFYDVAYDRGRSLLPRSPPATVWQEAPVYPSVCRPELLPSSMKESTSTRAC